MKTRLLMIAAAALIAGCNTMHGAGEDIQAGKNKVQNAFKHKDKSDQTSTTGAAPETTPPSPAATPTPSSSDTSGNGAAGATQ